MTYTFSVLAPMGRSLRSIFVATPDIPILELALRQVECSIVSSHWRFRTTVRCRGIGTGVDLPFKTAGKLFQQGFICIHGDVETCLWESSHLNFLKF